jgi:hypothetical protein
MALRQSHVDDCCDYWWRSILTSTPVCEPLGYDKVIHVSEEAPEDKNLGDEFKEKVKPLAEVDVVWTFK